MRHLLQPLWIALLVKSSHAASFFGEAAKNTARHAKRSLTILRQRGGIEHSNGTDVPSKMAAHCIKHTGGTCFTESCADWRGSTDCTHGRCFCSEDTCAGSDGKCHSQPYKMLLKKFKIRNVRWPDYYMYVSSVGYGIYVSDQTDSTSEFILRQLPGGKDVVLSSAHWPDYMVNVREQDNCQDTSLSQVSQESENIPKHYNVDCSKGGCFFRQQQKSLNEGCFSYIPQVERLEGILMGGHMSAPTAALKLEKAPQGGDHIMINSADFPGHYFYVAHASWDVGTVKGDPGTGGYWTFDPPLSLELPIYSGRRCTSDCG